MYNTIYYIFIVVLLGCKQVEPQFITDANGIITRKPELWITSTSVDDNKITIWDTPAAFGNIVVVSAWNGERDGVKGIDCKTGKILWEWYDDFAPLRVSFFKNSENCRLLHG